MKRNMHKSSLLVLPLLLAAAIPVAAIEQQPNDLIIRQTETHSVFKGLLYSVWNRLREINPQPRSDAHSNVIYTAGKRGAGATETLIQPYWKGDLAKDKGYQQQLSQFSEAQRLLDKGELKASVTAFDAFIQQYDGSNLMANALFAKGLGEAGLGHNQVGIAALNSFIESNPNHPLVADAQRVIQQLR
jgi:TolA-binding protein